MDFLASVKVRRMAVGGAIGGFVTFLIVNPSFLRAESGFHRNPVIAVIIIGLMIGSAIGSALIASEEIQSRRAKRTVFLGLSGTVVGGICGVIGSVIAGIIYAFMGPVSDISFIVQVTSRTIAWAVLGTAAGVCQGIVSRSVKRTKMGALGGLIGGGIGGFLFDGISIITQGGSASRFIGFTVMGAAIGIAVGLVEELRKEHWVTVLSGNKEGRSFILTKPVTFIGKDELADIPLFGDASVSKQHARIILDGKTVQLNFAAGSTSMVNNRPTSSATLNDGDIVTIGKHRLRFSSRASTASPFASTSASSTGLSGVPMQQPATIVPRVTAMSGPHSGESFVLYTSPYIIGRDPACHICLARDGMISWRHATLSWDGSAWRVDDNGSTNGLYVNGQKVTSQIVKPGDQISVGQTILHAS